jgi:AAA+ superfamily predicted ATPase
LVAARLISDTIRAEVLHERKHGLTLTSEARRRNPVLYGELATLARALRSAFSQPRADGPGWAAALDDIDENFIHIQAGQPAPSGGPSGEVAAPELLTCCIERFKLTKLETQLIVLALSVELDRRFGVAMAALNGRPTAVRPSAGVAAELLEPERATALEALVEPSKLLRYGLLELDGEGPLALQSIRVPRDLALRLAGLAPAAPENLAPAIPGALAELILGQAVRRQALAAADWLRSAGPEALLLVSGPPGSGRDALARAISGAAELSQLTVPAETIEARGRWPGLSRELRLARAALVVHHEQAPSEAMLQAVRHIDGPTIWVGPEAHAQSLVVETRRRCLILELPPPDEAARQQLWTRSLAGREPRPPIDIPFLADRFRFGPARIEAAVRLTHSGGDGRSSQASLQQACRWLTRGRMGEFAQRLDCPYERGELVVGPKIQRELDLILAWARHAGQVLRRTELGRRLGGGRNLVSLFSGRPGTGKTMAAQIVAQELGLDLYRIDLSQVVNKYIGETEKALARVFDEARLASAILFFDEADALFGKRTEGKDAVDRYANIETGYLLQRLEEHEGLVILATNLRRNLDDAFLRRIHVIAEFEAPGPAERREIWRRYLPPDVQARLPSGPLAENFALTGAEIRNAIASALLLAADERVPVEMKHLAAGISREKQKNGRLLDQRDMDLLGLRDEAPARDPGRRR